MSKSMEYRADIDALRAIAVLSVVVFHLNENWLPRGFLGVDVFFVISGYLLTGIIWREINDHKFSLITFYKRRIRRIMPALVFMLVVISLLSGLILLPADLVGYGKSMIASLLFVSNIYFWRDTNYFARGAEEKPLLNLWSLGIEEQFYIILPLLLIGLVRFMPRYPRATMWGLVIASFGLNWVLNHMGGSSPAFFLLPTRAWELGLGSVLAMTTPPAFAGLAGEADKKKGVWSWLGLVLILAGVGLPSPFPADVPAGTLAVLGTGLVLWIGVSPETRLGTALAFAPINLLGRISYSLYLWHWPLIVLAQYRLVRALSAPEAIGLLVVTLGISYVSWRLIEQPFRCRARPFHIVGLFSLAGFIVLGSAGLFLIQTEGLPGRLPQDAGRINKAVGTHFRCEVRNLLRFGASRACDLNLQGKDVEDAQIVLIGNSHAQMYAPIVREYAKSHDLSALLVPLNGCLPTVSLNLHEACLEMAQTNFDAVQDLPNVKLVIVAQSWPGDALFPDHHGARSRGQTSEVQQAWATVDLVQNLRQSGREVVLVGPLLVPGFDIASVLSRQLAYGMQNTVPSSADATVWQDKYAEAVQILTNADAFLVRPDQVQCRSGQCIFADEDGAIFADSNHLARSALSRFAPLFQQALDQVFIGTADLSKEQ